MIALLSIMFLLTIMFAFVTVMSCNIRTEKSKNYLREKAIVCMAANGRLIGNNKIGNLHSAQSAKLRLMLDLNKTGSRKSKVNQLAEMQRKYKRSYKDLFKRVRAALKRARDYVTRRVTRFVARFMIIRELNMNSGGESDEYKSHYRFKHNKTSGRIG